MPRNYTRVVEPTEDKLNDVLRTEQERGSTLIQTLSVAGPDGGRIVFVFEGLHRYYESRD